MKWYYADFRKMMIEPVELASAGCHEVRTMNGFAHYRNGVYDAYCRTWKEAKARIVKYWQKEEANSLNKIKYEKKTLFEVRGYMRKAMALKEARAGK